MPDHLFDAGEPLAPPAVVDDYGGAAANEFYTADMMAKMFRTTRRSILKWVAEGRIPKPQKFGRLARWSRAVVDAIRTHGVAPAPDRDELNRLPSAGLPCACPHCGGGLRLFRTGDAVATDPPAKAVAAAIKQARAAARAAAAKTKPASKTGRKVKE